MPFVRAGALDVGYEVRGAGPPMVMLHGATSSGREDWAAQVPLFGRSFLVYLPDARGHATTRWDVSDGFSAELLVDDVEALADVLGLSTFHLVGFSMGAMTALRFAIRHPERLRTLALSGISTEREPRLSVARRLMDVSRIEAEEPAWAAELAARHDPVQGRGAWRRLLEAIVADVVIERMPSPAELRRVDLPILVAAGDRDPFVPVDQAWRLARAVPDGRLLVAPDCPHEVMVRRAGMFNAACGGFFRSTESIARQRAASRRPAHPPDDHGGVR